MLRPNGRFVFIEPESGTAARYICHNSVCMYNSSAAVNGAYGYSLPAGRSTCVPTTHGYVGCLVCSAVVVTRAEYRPLETRDPIP
jgi:hypothetical protein